MSFGFSVGDVIAVGNLIKNISSCLQDTGGAKAEYQDLLRELECLQQALQHLDKLQPHGSPSSTSLDSIKYAALNCRRPLEQFLGKIRKYDKSLGVWGKEGRIVNTANKLKWGIGQKEEIRKLQNYLNIHVGTINILLAEHGLEKMDLASDKAAADQLDIRERLDETRGIIKTIRGSLAAQSLVVASTQRMTARLLDMISGDIRTSWQSLGEMVAKIFVSTQQTYAVMLDIKSSLAGPDTRWSFFQAPLAVEDALGYKFPVPSEYDFDLLDAIIKQKFKTGPGSLDVQVGNYEYFKTKNSNHVLSNTTRFLPGTAITMAIIVTQPTLTDETCPMPGCGSNQTLKPLGGGRTCCECNVWFSPTKKKRRSIHDLLSAISALPDSMADEDQSVENMRANKRLKLTNTEQDLSMFRNVRFSSDELPTQPMDIYTPASLENSGSSVHDLSHHDPNPQSDNKAEAIIDTDSDITSPLTKTLEQNAITRPVEFNDALSYVDQVKARFKDQLEIYEAFLKILQAYQKERKTSVDLYDQITKLFQSAPDLVQGFEAFLPPDHYTQLDSFHQAQIQTAVAAVDDDYDDEKGLRKRKR